jgi:hypothetical protein
VFALGPQSQQANNRRHTGGFLNSLATGHCNLMLLTLMPTASGIEAAADVAGHLRSLRHVK